VVLPLFQQPVCRQAAWRRLQLLMHAFMLVRAILEQAVRHTCCSPLHFIGSAATVVHQSRSAPDATTQARTIGWVMRAKTI
jgi:hypothetical protein